MTPSEVKERVESFPFALPTSRPRQLFGPGDLDELRARAAARDGLCDRLRARCETLAKRPAEEVDATLPRGDAGEAEAMAEGYVLFGEETYAVWARRRVASLLNIDTWIAPVHRSMCPHCDHVVTNVGASIGWAYDLLADTYTDAERDVLLTGLRRQLVEPYLAGRRDRAEWWARETCENNWRIMCNGEAGFALCGFVDHFAEAREVIALGAEGVVEILDLVPSEGDWPEGVNYWFATLRMGLRLLAAIRRLTGGAIDLFEHRALKVTGDYPMMLTTPGGRAYNFNDNDDTLAAASSEGLIMLAAAHGRGDWMAIARRFGADTLTHLAFDDPAIASQPARCRSACFPSTGVATMRSEWGAGETFIGLKCGPSNVGHSHLDAASFIIESGGAVLAGDEGYWPYAHFIGFFDVQKLRWNFDGVATVGHNTLIVDGQQQTWGPDYPGRITAMENGGNWQFVSCDAGATYPGLLNRFVRTVLLIGRDVVMVRDVIECVGERHVEWLLHTPGEFRDAGDMTLINSGGQTMSVTPLLPDRTSGWRVSDVVRTSTFENSNTRQMERLNVRYRSFAPFRAADAFEFLFVLRLGDATDKPLPFDGEAGNWRLQVSDGVTVVPDGEVVRVVAAQESVSWI